MDCPIRLKLLMAVSADGFVCRGPNDDMRWTGKSDKQAFRLLTSVGGVVGAGSTTFDQMPPLKHRQMVRISRGPGPENMSIGRFAYTYPDAWLIGGQTVAMEALETGMVGSVHMSCVEAVLGSGVPNTMGQWLKEHDWKRHGFFNVGDAMIHVWRPRG